MTFPRHPTPLSRITGVCLCLLMPLITLPVPLRAATLIWDPAQNQSGSGGAGSWDTLTSNWLSAGVDGTYDNVSGVTATFQGTGGLVTLNSSIYAGGLVFNSGGYTLAGNGTPQALTIGAGGLVVGASVAGPIVIGDSNLFLQQATPSTFTNNSSSLLTLAGSIDNAGMLLTLSATSSGGITFTSGISDTGGLTINSTGTGVVTLSGVNTYTGMTSVLAGTLKMGSAYAFSSASALTLANAAGAVFDLNGYNQSVASLSGGGALGGSVMLSGGATLTIGGAVTSLVGGYSQATNVSNPGSWNTFAGLISGTGSLAITGGGVVYLTNNNNSYTGFTNVLGGTLVVSNVGQLGAGTTPIVVSGFNSSLAGGALVVQGGTSGINFTRNLDVGGYGISGANNSAGYALVNIGNNTYSGIITSASNTETRVTSVAGTMTFSSGSTINISAGLDLQVNGYGNFLIDGFMTGGTVSTLSFYRWSGGGLLGQTTLGNPYNNFLGRVEVTGAFLRVSSPGSLGAAVDNASLESYAGSFELRVDPGNTDFSKKTINYASSSGSNFYAERAVGGVGLNQTVLIGGASVNGVVSPGFNEALTSGNVVTPFYGNDGYGVTIGSGGTITYGFASGAGVNHSYTSNLNGLLTLNSSFSTADTAATRTYTITANGDVLLTGNLLSTAGATDHIWTKAGYGALAIQGMASTNIGVFNITNGSVIVNALSALNVNTTSSTGSGGIQIGSTTVNGILNYAGSAAAGVGESSSKAVILSGTTGSAALFANQQQNAANTSATGLVLTSSIAATGVGAKTLYLEGYNNTGTTAVVNQITGLIQDNLAAVSTNKTSLLKGGNSTWLYAPTASTYAAATVAAGATLSTSGTTSSGGTVLNFASTTGLAVGQQVSGTNIAAGSYISSLTGTTVTLSTATSGAIASAASIIFGGESASVATLPTGSTSGSTVSGATTMVLASTTGLNVGMMITSAAGIPVGTYITAINSATNTITLSAATISSGVAVTFNGAASSNVVTLTSTSGLVVGQSVAGTNVPAGTVITAIYGNNVVLNNTIATSISAGTTLYFGSVGAAGVAESFSGTVTVTGGTLQVQPTAASGSGSAPLSSSNGLTFATDALTGNGYAGGTFQMLGSASVGTVNMTVGQITLTAGQGNVLTTANGGTPTLTFGNATPINATRGAGAVLNFSPGAGSTIQFTTSPTLTGGIIGLSATSTGFAYYTNASTSAVDFATVTGTGPYVVAPYSGYVSGLPVSGSVATSTYWINGSTITTTAAETINALKISGSASLTLGGVLTLNAAGSTSAVLFDNSSGSASIGASAAANTLGGAAGEDIIYTGGSSTTNTLTISAATLGTISTAGNITALRQGTTLDLNAAGSGGLTTIGALTGAGTVTNSGGVSGTAAATLSIGSSTSTASATFSGLLQDGSGVLNVTKNGTGTEYLNSLNGAVSSTTANGQTLGSIGYNTYSGVTTISGGTLSVTLLANYGSASSIGTGNAQGNAASLVLGTSAGGTGTLQYIGQNSNSFLDMVETPSVQTNRLFTLAGNGALDSSGGFGNSAVGTGNPDNAVMWFTNTGAVAFSSSGAKTLTLTGTSTGDNEIDLQLINNTVDSSLLSVTKTGTGTWVLGNVNNTYGGATTISAGALRAQDAGSNATSATALSSTVSSNVIDLASTSGLVVGQAVTGAGIAPGTTTVSAGNLQVGAAGVGSTALSATTVSGTGSAGGTVSGVTGGSSSVITATQLSAPTLSGTGTVGSVILGSVSTAGLLMPGDSGGTVPGKLTLNGALTVNSGSQIQFGITSSSANASVIDPSWNPLLTTAASYLALHATAGAGGTPDAIYTQWNTVSGTYSSLSLAGQSLSLGASVGGTPTVLVETVGSATMGEGDIFKLLDWSSVSTGTAGSIGTPGGSSAFSSASDLVLPTLSGGLQWDTSAFSTYGVVVVVPEPARGVLLLCGLVSLLLRRRRRLGW
jgi:autotransporter-associated beta strand protein